MKIKIIKSSGLGFVTNRDGEVHDCEQGGTASNRWYRLTGPLNHIRITDSHIAAQYAELVMDQEFRSGSVGQILGVSVVPAGGPVPMPSAKGLPETVQFMNGPLQGLVVFGPCDVAVGDTFGAGMVGAQMYRYAVSRFNISMLMWEAVLTP